MNGVKRKIFARTYYDSVGHFFVGVKVKDPLRCTVLINVVTDNGFLDVVITDDDGVRINAGYDLTTGVYSFKLPIKHRYEICISTKHHTGGFSVYF